MARVPTIAEEDAKRPNRERDCLVGERTRVVNRIKSTLARLGVVISQIRQIEEARQKRLEQHHETGPHAMVRLLARIVGVGVETADMLVHEACHGQCVTAEPWRAMPA